VPAPTGGSVTTTAPSGGLPDTTPSGGGASLSSDVINLLVKRGMTLLEIAQATGTTKSFISRVKSKSRSLTIDHLIELEQTIGEPLPLLLLQATPIQSVRSDLRPLYRATLKVVSVGKAAKPARKRSAKAA
jgi:transcriptional regulator with XRE-family HTH domain